MQVHAPAAKPAQPNRVWLSLAARLDWSKCPEAQSVVGETGNVWVVRGTRAPLAAIFRAVDEGQPFVEIAEAYGVSVQQLLAVMEFAAASVAPPAGR